MQHTHSQPPGTAMNVVSATTLSLVVALTDPASHSHEWHVSALSTLDAALQNPTTYDTVCLQFAALLHLCSTCTTSTTNVLTLEQQQEWQQSSQQCQAFLMRLQQQDASLWIPLGQTTGLILKNALTRPPSASALSIATAQQIQSFLLSTLLTSPSKELRSVASSIIASVAIVPTSTSSTASSHSHYSQYSPPPPPQQQPIQPTLHINHGWPTLLSTLHSTIVQEWCHHDNNNNAHTTFHATEGALRTMQKILEDGPTDLSQQDLDATIVVLIQVIVWYNSSNVDASQANVVVVLALQCFVACWSAPIWPYVPWDEYWSALSTLASASTTTSSSSRSCSSTIQHWICKSLVTLLDSRTADIAPVLDQLCPFLLSVTLRNTNDRDNDNDELVALEACDFWLTFASLDDSVLSGEMHDVIGDVLPQLIPILLQNMVYSKTQQQHLLQVNQEAEANNNNATTTLRPIFHKSRNAPQITSPSSSTGPPGSSTNQDGNDNDDDIGEADDGDDDDDDDDEDGWTLRKCSAASLDALANLYGGEIILPLLLPSLERGLQQTSDPWLQEACVLALGAIAEGCWDEMYQHMTQIHPYLMHLLSAGLNSNNNNSNNDTILPQLKCMAAWTLGQYAGWAVEQVQNGTMGTLLGQMTHVLIQNIHVASNPQIQVSCGAALGVVAGSAGDLLAPYLEPMFVCLSNALSRYHGRSLITILDVFGTMGECCGPAIAEGHLPTLYIPQLLQLWDHLVQRNVGDRILLTLMESVASLALASASNFQPYAVEVYEKSMHIIESTTLLLASTPTSTTTNEEDVDPIIAATDLIDSLVEGLGSTFGTLLQTSSRYGPNFLNVLLALIRHDMPGVRMSALAVLGDMARNTPSTLEPALAVLLPEAISNMDDPLQPSVAINAVWAVGEVCIRCKGHPEILEPFAPAILQNAMGLLVGNGGSSGNSGIHGLTENAAACMGRLALVQPQWISTELVARGAAGSSVVVVVGWCDAMGKIRDERERHDAYTGFCHVVYANPQAVLQLSSSASSLGNNNGMTTNDGTNPSPTVDAIVAILFAIVTWHIPPDLPPDSMMMLFHSSDEADDDGNSNNINGSNGVAAPRTSLVAFPTTEAVLGKALIQLVQDIKRSVGDVLWNSIQQRLPLKVQQLFRETYNV